MKGLRLYKKERLCGVSSVDTLFIPPSRRKENHATMAYPWRAVWTINHSRQGQCARFLISVPKKRLKHAVDRVAMRRRCREAYRLQRHLFDARTSGIDIAFVFVSDSLVSYSATQASVVKILTNIQKYISEHPEDVQYSLP